MMIKKLLLIPLTHTTQTLVIIKQDKDAKEHSR